MFWLRLLATTSLVQPRPEGRMAAAPQAKTGEKAAMNGGKRPGV
jgi:hypothetical protein